MRIYNKKRPAPVAAGHGSIGNVMYVALPYNYTLHCL